MKKQTKKVAKAYWPTLEQFRKLVEQAKAKPYTGALRHVGSAY